LSRTKRIQDGRHGRNRHQKTFDRLSIYINIYHLAFTAPYEGEFCLTEILGNKITLLSCPILALSFLFYSTLLILIYTKIRLHLATVCPSGPCIQLPDLVYQHILGCWSNLLGLKNFDFESNHARWTRGKYRHR